VWLPLPHVTCIKVALPLLPLHRLLNCRVMGDAGALEK